MSIDNKLIIRSNLKRYRVKFTRLTQREVASLCGIPLRTYQAYEQSERALSHANISYIKAIGRLFELDMNCIGLLF